jgi:glutaconate CoA-transferase subunit A
VQGYYSRDNEFFREYHAQTKTSEDYSRWRGEWIDSIPNRAKYVEKLGSERVDALCVKKHAYAAAVDYGY